MGTLFTQLRGWWRRIEPALTIDRDAMGVERMDGAGEGPSTSISFEGCGLSLIVFAGRTPRFKPDDDAWGHELTRWYAGEAA